MRSAVRVCESGTSADFVGGYRGVRATAGGGADEVTEVKKKRGAKKKEGGVKVRVEGGDRRKR